MSTFGFEDTIYFTYLSYGGKPGYYKWSPEQGYIVEHDDECPKNVKIVDMKNSCYSYPKLRFPDAVLARLSKVTRYNYLSDGYYKCERIYREGKNIYVPMHWLKKFNLYSDDSLSLRNGKLIRSREIACKFCIDDKVIAEGETLADIFNIVALDISYIFGMMFRKGIPQDHTDINVVCMDDDY